MQRMRIGKEIASIDVDFPYRIIYFNQKTFKIVNFDQMFLMKSSNDEFVYFYITITKELCPFIPEDHEFSICFHFYEYPLKPPSIIFLDEINSTDPRLIKNRYFSMTPDWCPITTINIILLELHVVLVEHMTNLYFPNDTVIYNTIKKPDEEEIDEKYELNIKEFDLNDFSL